MTVAPIALFVFNRLDHLTQVLDSLRLNSLALETTLYVFSDGPRSDADSGVFEVRDFLKTLTGFKEVIIHEKTANQGLARSVIDGISYVLKNHDRVIVLEDDLVVAPSFLEFMNSALEKYSDEPNVISISAYNYPGVVSSDETFFIRGADCWGWATWKRGWDLFEHDGQKLLNEIVDKDLQNQFDLGGSYSYSQMLKDQIDGKNNSWAIRWHASAFLKNKLTLYPRNSLVNNIGHDDSGTHCGSTNAFSHSSLPQLPPLLKDIPLEENHEALEMIQRFFQTLKPSFVKKWKRSFKKRYIAIQSALQSFLGGGR